MIFRYLTFLTSEFAFLHQQKNLELQKISACNFIKKRNSTRVLSYEFCDIFNDTFFAEHLRAMSSGYVANACWNSDEQEQPSRGVLRKWCSENMQQIYRRTPMPKCDFNKVALQLEITLRHECSPVNLLHISRTPFLKNTYGGEKHLWLLLNETNTVIL